MQHTVCEHVPVLGAKELECSMMSVSYVHNVQVSWQGPYNYAVTHICRTITMRFAYYM